MKDNPLLPEVAEGYWFIKKGSGKIIELIKYLNFKMQRYDPAGPD